MSPHRVQRQAAWSLLLGVIAIIALVVSVWLVGARFTDDLHRSQHEALLAQTRQLRAGCARSVARDFELVAMDEDLRAIGATSRGPSARGVSARASGRLAATRSRLPSAEDPVTVARFCAALYPMP